MSVLQLTMLKRYMHKRERYFAMLNDNRIVRPFEWGTEFITDHPNGDDPRKLFAEYSKKTVENSTEFFFSPKIADFELGLQNSAPFKGGVAASRGRGGSVSSHEPQTLTWTSGIETPWV
jgi:hypothetical protein